MATVVKARQHLARVDKALSAARATATYLAAERRRARSGVFRAKLEALAARRQAFNRKAGKTACRKVRPSKGCR